MTDWQDLRQRFASLETALAQVRVEHQWTSTTDEWRLAGRHDLDSAKRFYATVAEASALLAQVPDLPDAVRNEPEDSRWYRALWEMTGPHEEPVTGMMSMAGRQAGGPVNVAHVSRPAARSAQLAARFAGGKA